MNDRRIGAHHRVMQAAVHVLSSTYADEGPYADAQAEWADEQLELAARELALAVAADEENPKPVGW